MELTIRHLNGEVIGTVNSFEEALNLVCADDELRNPSIPAAWYDVRGIEPSDDPVLYEMAQAEGTTHLLTKDEDCVGFDLETMTISDLEDVIWGLDYRVER